MRTHKSVIISLFAIFLLAVILRFWHLGINPVGLHRDEAFLGYNAYSILKTGKDMSGNSFPLHLQSFFYSPAGYSYASIPFIWMFGLNEFSTRFVSAFFGSLSVLATFFFVKKLMTADVIKKETHRVDFLRLSYEDVVSLLSSFVLAISPWHINASRVAMENTLVVFLLIVGIFLFLQYITSKNVWILFLTFLFFSLSFTIYQAPRAFIPLLLPMIFFLYKDRLISSQKILIASMYALFILLPLIGIIRSPELSLRIHSLSVFNSPHAQLKIDESIREDGVNQGSTILARAMHNKIIGYSTDILNNYFSHFSFDFLFRDKSYPTRMTIFGSGNLYLIELVFLVVGLYVVATHRSRMYLLIIGWIAIAPMGSALTYDDVPNMQRTLLIQPALSILIAFGIYALVNHLKKLQYITPFVVVCIFLYSYNITQYLHDYYIHQAVRSAQFRNVGYKELVKDVTQRSEKFKRIVITNAESAPSVFFLFFTEYDPIKYQHESLLVDKNKSDSINFSSYVFESSDCPLNSRLGYIDGIQYTPHPLSDVDKSSLFVQHRGCPVATPSAEIIKSIYQPNGQEVFQLVRTK